MSFLSTPGVYYLYGRLSYFLTLHKETVGSLKFPGYPHEHMPWSKTPVVSRTLALSHPRLLPSGPLHAVGFLPHREIILMTTTIPISGLNTEPALDPGSSPGQALIQGPASLFRPASDSRCRAYPRTSLLTCWLDFGQVGLGSH